MTDAAPIVLRAFRDDDLPRVLESFRDPEVATWNAAPADEAGARAWMQARNDRSATDHVSWAVADPSGELLGSVSLHHIDHGQADAQAGYWVAPSARRRGVATAGLRAALRHGFGELGLRRVYLYHAVENPGSCAVARACGFRHEGTLLQSFRYADGVCHDEHLHALLASEWALLASDRSARAAT